MTLFKKKVKKVIDIESLQEVDTSRELSLEDWLKEFKVGSKFVLDTSTEIEIKKLVIASAQKYCHANQNRVIL